MIDIPHNDETDLILTRIVPATPEQLYRGWTDPNLMEEWFCPKPWRVTDVKLDLRPGGESSMTMRGPNGEQFPEQGCYLELIPNRRIVFTDLLTAGYRPVDGGMFVGVITFEPVPEGTRYTARALHKTRESRDKHAEMGFHEGWGKALDQLVELTTRPRAS